MSDFEVAKLVASVIDKKATVPVMSNLHFYDNRVQATDGTMNFDGPWPREGNPVNLPADKFVAALQKIKNPKFESKDGNLIVKGGRMRAKMAISTDPYPLCEKPQIWEPLDDSIKEPLRKLKPFMGVDADIGKLFARTIMYSDGWLYATNNVTLVRVQWETSWNNNFILPDFAVDLILRTPHEITALHDRENAGGIEFGDYWIEFKKYQADWPDIGKFFNYDWDLPKLPEGAQQAVKDLLPFTPSTGRVPVICFKPGAVTTMTGESEAEIEMKFDVDEPAHFFAEPIIKILSIADCMDLSQYPKPIPFSGDGVQGVTMGVRA